MTGAESTFHTAASICFSRNVTLVYFLELNEMDSALEKHNALSGSIGVNEQKFKTWESISHFLQF